MKNTENYTTIYIVRHGETEHNVNKVIQGQTDSPLTQKGLEQAAEAGKLFEGVHFDVVFASDLARAKRTAEIIVSERKLAVNTNELLRERRFGKYEDRPEKEFLEENKELFEKLKTMSDAENHKAKFDANYESDEEVTARLITILRELAVTYVGKNVLVVSHGGVIRILLVHLGFATLAQLPRGSKVIENLAYIKLESDGVDFFVRETKGINKQEKAN